MVTVHLLCYEMLGNVRILMDNKVILLTYPIYRLVDYPKLQLSLIILLIDEIFQLHVITRCFQRKESSPIELEREREKTVCLVLESRERNLVQIHKFNLGQHKRFVTN